MEWANFDLPDHPWDLSAPESQVLLSGPETDDAWVLKLAFVELLLRRRYSLVAARDRRLLFFSKTTNVFVNGQFLGAGAPRPLQAVIECVPKPRTYVDGTIGVSVRKFSKEVFTRYTRRRRAKGSDPELSWSSGSYVQVEVLPTLLTRGYFRTEKYTRLGIFDRHRWVITDSGKTKLAELQTILAFGRGPLAHLISDDPDRARQFVANSGVALALLGDPTDQLRRLLLWSERNDVRGYPDPNTANFASDVGGRGSDIDSPAGSTFPGRELALLSVATWCGHFGPGPADGLGAAIFAISAEVDQAWNDISSSGGGE